MSLSDSVKVGNITLSNNNGFTLIEVLLAFMIVFIVITTIVPIVSLIEYERTILSDRRTYTHVLHDELQPYLWESKATPDTYTKKIAANEVTFQFSKREHLVKDVLTGKMLNKRMKKYVCMVKRNDDRGFSIVSMLLIMTVLSITLPLLSILLQKSSFEHDYDAISVQQFFMFLRNHLLEAKTYTVDEETLHLQLATEKNITNLKYQQYIHRQYHGKCHEIYLAYIQQLSYTSLPFGIRMTVTTLQGETYEKSIVFYE